MTFLFVYSYTGYKKLSFLSGDGSVDLSYEGNRITPEVIKKAKEWVIKYLEDKGMYDVSLTPMGWFKYDGDEDEDCD